MTVEQSFKALMRWAYTVYTEHIQKLLTHRCYYKMLLLAINMSEENMLHISLNRWLYICKQDQIFIQIWVCHGFKWTLTAVISYVLHELNYCKKEKKCMLLTTKHKKLRGAFLDLSMGKSSDHLLSRLRSMHLWDDLIPWCKIATQIIN